MGTYQSNSYFHNCLSFFAFLYFGRKITLFESSFRNLILAELHVLRPNESENPSFSGWSVCETTISITQKQKKEKKFKFGILNINHTEILP